MDTKERKVGRPKATPRTGPLVLGDDRGRARVTLEISERAAGELAEYTRWVEQCSGMAASEAKFMTVDFALREIFRRDRVWQTQRRALASAPTPSAAPPTSTVTTVPTPAPNPTPTAHPPAPRAAAGSSSSLPPPTPREPRSEPVTGARHP